ncbi:hypothetical protein OHB39_07180 [Streptomyces sp. NBC_00047]|uniref:hypothetical protein n=1 Tax=Streptomyces sp. NBC_00047 TaxID=2975627 RepID=UPI0022596060|nr:hypothetical protein [Streptomyces sp. NBC_00047]MCX5607366.1 hypothetical protein [Streptomyces sp. NBC_00047]
MCAPREDGLNWLKVAVARVDDRTSRVYLRGLDRAPTGEHLSRQAPELTDSVLENGSGP